MRLKRISSFCLPLGAGLILITHFMSPSMLRNWLVVITLLAFLVPLGLAVFLTDLRDTRKKELADCRRHLEKAERLFASRGQLFSRETGKGRPDVESLEEARKSFAQAERALARLETSTLATAPLMRAKGLALAFIDAHERIAQETVRVELGVITAAAKNRLMVARAHVLASDDEAAACILDTVETDLVCALKLTESEDLEDRVFGAAYVLKLMRSLDMEPKSR